MDNKFGKYQCTLPFSHFHVTSRGTITPCCNFSFRHNEDFKKAIFQMYEKPESSDPSLPKVQNGIENIMFGTMLWNNLKKKSLKNEKESGCANCYFSEEAGAGSRRIWANKTFPDAHGVNEIRSAELKLGAKCNLGCRTCSSTSSNKLLKENSFEQFGELNKDWIKETQQKSDWIHDESFWEEFKRLSTNIEYIQFTGGEPLIINEHFEYLKWLGENNINPTVQYITNATIGPTDDMKEIWNKFDNIIIDFSIDAVGKLGEYMRTGAVWNEQIQNIKDFVEFAKERKASGMQTNFGFSTTVSIMNVTELHAVYDIFYDLGLNDFGGSMSINLVRYPEYLDIANLNGDAKECAIQSIEKIKKSNRFHERHTEKLNVVLLRLDYELDKKYNSTDRMLVKEKMFKLANPSKSISYEKIMPDWWNKLVDNT